MDHNNEDLILYTESPTYYKERFRNKILDCVRESGNKVRAELISRILIQISSDVAFSCAPSREDALELLISTLSECIHDLEKN
jgi:hypothetical protein